MKHALFLLILVIAMPAAAKDPIFVRPEQINAMAILPAPPDNESAATKAELAELHRIQDRRSEADVKKALADADEEDIFIFKTVLGDQFTPANFPALAILSAHVANDEGPNANVAKVGFNRARPYDVDTTIHSVCKTAKSNSYPSGHGTIGYLEGLTLSLLVPEKRDLILARAEDYGRSRLICGVHYGSDLEASKRLAYAMFGAMQSNPQFQAELGAAREELRKAALVH